MYSSVKGTTNMTFACSNCGTVFKDKVEYCEKCGTNLMKEEILNKQKSQSSTKNPSELNNKLQGQIQILAVIEIAFGIMGIFAGLITAFLSNFIVDIINTGNIESGATLPANFPTFINIILITSGIFILVFSSVAIFFGIKLYNLQHNGRFGTMVIASLLLVMVPFGTIFGVISLVLLNDPKTIQLIRDRNNYL